MPARAAGTFRRTTIERSDQRVWWERADQAFFAAGACHILAWVCRDSYPEQSIGLAAMLSLDEGHVLHVYATWNDWAFDYSGWNLESELLAVNAGFEGISIDTVEITVGLAEFCAVHAHRMPHQYWHDPLPRARDYLSRHLPPWVDRFR